MTDFIYKIANGTAIYRGRVLNSIKYGTKTIVGDFNKPAPELYFTIHGGGTVQFIKGSNSTDNTFYYSLDDGATWISSSTTTSWSLGLNSNLRLKAYANNWFRWVFSSTSGYTVSGNIMSLLYGDEFLGKTTLPSNYTFDSLFSNSRLTNASNLLLPATELANGCYASMFKGCTHLTSAPALPATTIDVPACYQRMFEGCTHLTSAPALPALKIDYYCYASMFKGCTSLVNAPDLPAQILLDYCYEQMFYGCSSLKSITCYAIRRVGSHCLNYWVSGVSATGDFYKKDTSWTATGDSEIPTGWTQHNI